jgi:hypothetical protein
LDGLGSLHSRQVLIRLAWREFSSDPFCGESRVRLR